MERPVQITRLPKSEFYETMFELSKGQNRVPSQILLSRLSKSVCERLITVDEVAAPDCITCGACCVYGLIPIDRSEPQQLSEYIELTLDSADVVIEKALPRDEESGSCKHLIGTVGEEIGCDVYLDRPRVCRNFDAGSDRCFGYRRMHGIDPPLDDDALAEALRKLDARPPPLKIWAVHMRLESRTLTFDRTAADPANAVAEELAVKIVAHMNDGDVKEIHSYDPTKEEWYEYELQGLTLDQAMEKIEQERAG